MNEVEHPINEIQTDVVDDDEGDSHTVTVDRLNGKMISFQDAIRCQPFDFIR